MSRSISWKNVMDNPGVKLIGDTALVTGIVALPMWVYTLSAWAGFLTVMLGLIVVIIRLIIALRDFRRGRRVTDEQVKNVIE